MRLPYVAKREAMRVHRFHSRKNYKDSTKEMCPDSYVAIDWANSSSSEEKNALARRQQHHLWQINQKHFLLFSVYQLALWNVNALNRDNLDERTMRKWPPGPFRIRGFQQNLGYIQIYSLSPENPAVPEANMCRQHFSLEQSGQFSTGTW